MLSILTIIIIIVDQKSGLLFLPSLNTLPDVTHTNGLKNYQSRYQQVAILSVNCRETEQATFENKAKYCCETCEAPMCQMSACVETREKNGNTASTRSRGSPYMMEDKVETNHLGLKLALGFVRPNTPRVALGLPLKHNEERIQQWKTNIWV